MAVPVLLVGGEKHVKTRIRKCKRRGNSRDGGNVVALFLSLADSTSVDVVKLFLAANVLLS
jgi:hypothetical protein